MREMHRNGRFEYIPLLNSRRFVVGWRDQGIRKEFFESFLEDSHYGHYACEISHNADGQMSRCELDITQDFFTDAGREYARG